MTGDVSKAGWPFKVNLIEQLGEQRIEPEAEVAMAGDKADLLRAAAYLEADEEGTGHTIDAAEADRLAGVLRRLAGEA